MNEESVVHVHSPHDAFCCAAGHLVRSFRPEELGLGGGCESHLLDDRLYTVPKRVEVEVAAARRDGKTVLRTAFLVEPATDTGEVRLFGTCRSCEPVYVGQPDAPEEIEEVRPVLVVEAQVTEGRLSGVRVFHRETTDELRRRYEQRGAPIHGPDHPRVKEYLRLHRRSEREWRKDAGIESLHLLGGHPPVRCENGHDLSRVRFRPEAAKKHHRHVILDGQLFLADRTPFPPEVELAPDGRLRVTLDRALLPDRRTESVHVYGECPRCPPVHLLVGPMRVGLDPIVAARPRRWLVVSAREGLVKIRRRADPGRLPHRMRLVRAGFRVLPDDHPLPPLRPHGSLDAYEVRAESRATTPILRVTGTDFRFTCAVGHPLERLELAGPGTEAAENAFLAGGRLMTARGPAEIAHTTGLPATRVYRYPLEPLPLSGEVVAFADCRDCRPVAVHGEDEDGERDPCEHHPLSAFALAVEEGRVRAVRPILRETRAEVRRDLRASGAEILDRSPPRRQPVEEVLKDRAEYTYAGHAMSGLLSFAAPAPDALRCAAGHSFAGEHFQLRGFPSRTFHLLVVDGVVFGLPEKAEEPSLAADGRAAEKVYLLVPTPITGEARIAAPCPECPAVEELVNTNWGPVMHEDPPRSTFDVVFRDGRVESLVLVGREAGESGAGLPKRAGTGR